MPFKLAKYISKGAVHIHSTYSDGTGSIEEISLAAKSQGIDWIIITDHNNLKGIEEEGWRNGVAVLVGEEISPKTGNHYLAFDIKKGISPQMKPEEFIEEVNQQGGFGFIAHPDEKKQRQNKFPPLRWQDWKIKTGENGFQGLEIWNFMSDWVDKFDEKNPAYWYFFRHKLISGATKDTLKWWDRLNNDSEHIVPAVGSLDSHALDYKIVKIFPYADLFKTITNYIYTEEKLSSDFEQAKKQIYSALKNGNNLIVNRILNKNSDLAGFYIENSKRIHYPGDIAEIDNENILKIRLPMTADIRLVRNSEVILEINTKEFQMENLLQGKYRLEVFYKNCPYIYSNPIFLKGDKE